MDHHSDAPLPPQQEAAREEALFEALLGLPVERRSSFLERACAGDMALRRRLETLLQSHEQAQGFLEPPVAASAPAPTMVLSLAPTEKPGDTIGRYKIREKLGEGGCGVVYVAEQTEPVRRRVALKIIKLGMDTRSVIARFEAERQALAMMDHPNIAKVLDAGSTEAGRPYFVMELVRGIRITDYCDQNQLDTVRRLGLFIQVCRAIQHAHQKGVIHRDIKPSNILVTLHDGVPVPKVIDFGIAKATEGRLTDLTVYTELRQLIGTPAYMSPEQAEMSGLDVDTRSDLYSLGVLLYELLTGQPPFDPQQLLRAGLDEMRRTIREQEPQRPSTRLSTLVEADLTTVAKRHSAEAPRLIHYIRGDLDWIVMKALEKDRTRRYETANGLANDVQRFLSDEPVEARPPSNLYRFQKLVRRNQAAFAAAGGVLAALVLGLGLSLHLYVRERAALGRAVSAERQQAELRRQAEEGLRIERKMRELAPIGEKLTTAGLLMSRGQFDTAQELMNQVPPTPDIPSEAALFDVLGMIQAVKGNDLPLAITNYRRSLVANPTNHIAYDSLAPLLVRTGDLKGYEANRDRMLQLFAATTDPAIAARTVKDCLLLPASAAQLDTIGKLAETAVAAGPTNSCWEEAELAKGMLDYRQERFASAVTWLEKIVVADTVASRTAQAALLLGLAQHRLEQPEKMRAALAKGVHLVEEKLARSDSSRDWNERMIAQILMGEAKEQFK